MPKLSELRKKNLELARKAVKQAATPDVLIIHAITNIEDLQRAIHVLAHRLREWYSIYLPELSKKIQDNEIYVSLVLEKERKALMKELNLKQTIGSDLKKEDLKPIMSLANAVEDLYSKKDVLENYLKQVMQEHCPNLLTVAGASIGARLLRGAGSLKKLAFMRSSTIQLLGAEKALFRHIQTGAKPPKYGYIINHEFVQKAGKIDKGKAARVLADKIFLAARVDYFKGEYIGDELLKELEARFKKINK